MKKLLIWGAGDQGTVTLDCALAMNVYDPIDFLDIKEKGHRQIPGYRIYEEAETDLAALLIRYDEVIVASGSNTLREEKMKVLNSLHIPSAVIIHPTAVISPSARIGKGCTIQAYSVINTNAQIGTGCIINTGAVIEHDCAIGDYVNICPKVSLAGHTTVGEKSFLGIGCTVIDDIQIGKETVIGAGAVVIRNIPDHAAAVGVPAHLLSSS